MTPTPKALVYAVEAAGIAPAPLEGPHLWASQEGLPSMIDGRMLALGRLECLQRLGLEPRAGEIDVARRQEERGRVLFFLVAICIGQCVGLFGVRHSAAWRSPSYPYRASGPPPS